MATPDKPEQSRWWKLWNRPHKWWLLWIPTGGIAMFFVGILVWGGFHTAIEATNSLEFCTSCHEMSYNFEEYKQTAHYKNEYGVRAICTDCHVPKPWGPMIVRKVQATSDVYHHLLGTIDTEEKFEARRLEMAKDVWARMRASDSRECRNCHSFEAMDRSKQSHQASKKHSAKWIERTGKTCIDCHQGVAHKLPELTE